jgi:intein/homing endonuclease
MIKIKKTNEFKEIEFRSIMDADRPVKILTPCGFTHIKAFQFIKRGPTKRIKTKFGEILCDPKHRVLTTNGEKFVSHLDKDDRLIGYKNEEVSFDVSNGPETDLYDIEIDNPHWYYTSGIVSHNSIALTNSGVGNLKMGQNVLHVTLEMPTEKIALRYLGCLTDKWISLRHKHDVQAAMTDRLQKVKSTYGSELVIAEHAPGEITVETIRMHLDVLRRVHGINIDVVVVDYLELMKPREKRRDDNDYTVQKDISTDLCSLAKNENVLVFSAFQTNREGNSNLNTSSDDKVIDINKVAESYGKTFSVDYLVTINQNKSEYEEGKKDGFNVNAVCRFWVAKNRSGEKFVMVYGRINYMTMKITEDHTDHS